jgi:hypothetical protein
MLKQINEKTIQSAPVKEDASSSAFTTRVVFSTDNRISGAFYCSKAARCWKCLDSHGSCSDNRWQRISGSGLSHQRLPQLQKGFTANETQKDGDTMRMAGYVASAISSRHGRSNANIR